MAELGGASEELEALGAELEKMSEQLESMWLGAPLEDELDFFGDLEGLWLEDVDALRGSAEGEEPSSSLEKALGEMQLLEGLGFFEELAKMGEVLTNFTLDLAGSIAGLEEAGGDWSKMDPALQGKLVRTSPILASSSKNPSPSRSCISPRAFSKLEEGSSPSAEPRRASTSSSQRPSRSPKKSSSSSRGAPSHIDSSCSDIFSSSAPRASSSSDAPPSSAMLSSTPSISRRSPSRVQFAGPARSASRKSPSQPSSPSAPKRSPNQSRPSSVPAGADVPPERGGEGDFAAFQPVPTGSSRRGAAASAGAAAGKCFSGPLESKPQNATSQALPPGSA